MWLYPSITLAQVMHLDAEKEMMSQCVALLGKFIAVREPNIRYLGLVSYRMVLSVLPLCLHLYPMIKAYQTGMHHVRI